MPETNTSQPDWQAKEAQAAIDEQRKHPMMYPLTKREQLREDYADELREERAARKTARRQDDY
jgi:hypothetical protein